MNIAVFYNSNLLWADSRNRMRLQAGTNGLKKKGYRYERVRAGSRKKVTSADHKMLTRARNVPSNVYACARVTQSFVGAHR